MLELNLFGIPVLQWEGELLSLPSPKNLAILSYLALKGESVSRKDLSELFWKDGKPSNVRFVLHKLREIPGSEDWLETSETFVSVKAVTDVKRFENAIHDERYGEALEIHLHGEVLLKGLELNDAEHFMNWLESERSRLNQHYLEALQGHISELERANKTDEALRQARRLLEQDKLNENVHRAIMRLEHKRGNTEAALAQFETLRQVLREELNVEPLEETLKLLRDIEGGGASSVKNALILTSATAIPAKPDKLFGRDTLLENVEAHLANNKRVLLHGFGGMGKTALATLVAAKWLEQNKAPVLWLQAGNDDATILFDAIARTFDAQQTLSQSKNAAKAIRDLLVKNKISLFILDDVWNAYALSKVMEAAPESIPLLVTSRQRYPNLTRVDVGRLERKAALELLTHFVSPAPLPPCSPSKTAGEKGRFEDENPKAVSEVNARDFRPRKGAGELNALCELLGDHAFALRIAGITLAVDGLTPEQLLERIANAPHTLKTPLEFSEAGRESVAALLSASLTALSEEAYEAFMGFGVLFTTSCTAELLALCTRRSEEETEEALINLQKRGLAERVSEAGSDVITYRLHDLAYSFARTNNHFRRSSAERACKTFLEKHHHDFDKLDAEITNLLGATETAEKEGDKEFLVAMMRCLVVGDAYYLARGHSPRSLELLKRAVKASKALGDKETAHYLVARLGDCYGELLGDYEAAFNAFKDALNLAQACENHHREIVMLTLMGTTRSRQGAKDAETYYQEAQVLAENYHDDKALCQVLEHRGIFAGWQKNFAQSRSYFQHALEAIDRLADTSLIEEAELARLRFFMLHNLGTTERSLNNMKGSLACFEETLNLAQRHDNQLWLAYAWQGFGKTYHAMNEHSLAQKACHEALELYQQNHAPSALADFVAFMQKANYGLPETVLERLR